MYTLGIESNDRAIALPRLPKPAGIGPLIVSSDSDFRFAYPIASDFLLQRGSSPDTEPEGSFVEMVIDEEPLAQERLSDVYALWEVGICSGYVYESHHNQKLLRTHPLAERGMFPCGVFEVKPSSWLHHLQSAAPENFPSEIMSGYHPATQTATVKHMRYHHLLFTFLDTTLEFITDRLSCELFRGAERLREEIQFLKWSGDYSQ
jgi:hypothetical protein